MSRVFGTLAVVMVLGMFGVAVRSYLNTPIVMKSTSQNVAVACLTPDHGEQAAATLICQEVLKGKYEVEWVR